MSSDDLQDGELITRVAAGDAEAFAQLFRRRQGQVYRFALHMTASPSVAEDVTQEVFLAVMSDAGRYDAARASVAAWLCGIARYHVAARSATACSSRLATATRTTTSKSCRPPTPTRSAT